MIRIQAFTFNPFSENTYLLSDETKECVIIDPGCHVASEEKELQEYIRGEKLQPVKLLNTHCHVDHVFGNYFVAQTWKLELEMHEKDLSVLQSFPQICMMYGFPGSPQPEPAHFFDEGDKIRFGNTTLDILFTPGHSPGSVCFYNAQEKFLIGGDVLFYEGIGRSDLPGGDAETLFHSIRKKLFLLPGDVTVYSGHGPETTIGHEKKFNPFVGTETNA